MAVSENDVAEGGEVTVAAAAFAPVEPDAPAEGEHPVEAPVVRETAGPGRTAAETGSVDHQAAPEQSAVRRSARRWSRPATRSPPFPICSGRRPKVYVNRSAIS